MSHLFTNGMHRFAQSYHCIKCQKVVDLFEKVQVDYVISDWKHWGKIFFNGVRETTSKGRPTGAYKIPPYQGLARMQDQGNVYFCLSCFQDIFGPIANNCGSCSKEIDKTESHSTVTFVFRYKRGHNSVVKAEYHHDCLPDTFDKVKAQVKECQKKVFKENKIC